MTNSKREINQDKGKRLKQYLKLANITQTRLEELAEIEPKSISPIVRGKNNLTEKTARKIITALNDINGAPEYRLQYLMCEDNIPTETELRLIKELSAAQSRSETLFNVLASRFPDLLNVDITECVYMRNDRLEVRSLPRSKFDEITEEVLDYAKYLCERAFRKAEKIPDEKAIEVMRLSRARNSSNPILALQEGSAFFTAHLLKRQWTNADIENIDAATRPDDH